MTSSTPTPRRKRKLGGLAVAMTVAPFHFANCAAKEPTPPLAPWMRKVLRGDAFAVSRTTCHAVRAGIGSEAATTKSSDLGFRTRSLTGTAAYSATVPQA